MKKLIVFIALASTTLASTNDWHWQPSILPKAYVIEGLWSDYFQIVPALHTAGLPSTRIPVTELTATDPGLAQHAVIVLGNTDAILLTKPRLARIQEFVANGGGLVVLGGECGFGRGGYTNTPLETIVPATFPNEHLIPRYTNGLALTRAPSATWLTAFDASQKPLVFYANTLRPKPGATVQLLAGDQPAIISGTYGKGRVVAIGLSVNGEAPAGKLAFWEWPEWPKILGQACDWAAGARPVVVDVPVTETTKPLTTDELNDFALGLKVPKDMLARALAHPNAEVAQSLFTQITAPDADGKITLANALPVLLPFAKLDWGPRLAERVEAFDPNREDRNAALILLGATRSPVALPRLLSALAKPETKYAAIAGLGYAGDPKSIPMLLDTYNKALRASQVPNETEWFNPDPFTRETAVPATEAALALYRLGEPDGIERVLAINRHVRLYFRIYLSAGRRELRNWSDPVGQAILKNIYDAQDRLSPAYKSLERHAAPIPASQITAFVKVAQEATDPLNVDWLVAEMKQSLSAYPLATWQPLTSAKDGIIARLARVAMATKPAGK